MIAYCRSLATGAAVLQNTGQRTTFEEKQSGEAKAEELADLMTMVRADTLKLFEMAREEELHESPGFGFRPVIWHLAHIGAFEATGS